jgi:hypothetical protein
VTQNSQCQTPYAWLTDAAGILFLKQRLKAHADVVHPTTLGEILVKAVEHSDVQESDETGDAAQNDLENTNAVLDPLLPSLLVLGES